MRVRICEDCWCITISAQTHRETQARHDSRSHTSTRKLGNGNVGLVVCGENILARGEDIDLVAKVGERGEGVIDGGCTDSDGLRDTSRGNVICILTLISGGDDEGDALANDIGHLWNACQRVQGVLVVINRKNTHRIVNGNIRRSTQAHRNDGGSASGEGFYSGSVDAGDDGRCGPGAIVVHDLDAMEGGVLCDAEDPTSDCASDMGAIWKERREQRSGKGC